MTREEHESLQHIIELYNFLTVEASCWKTELDTAKSFAESLQVELMKCYQEIAELRRPLLVPSIDKDGVVEEMVLPVSDTKIVKSKPLKIKIPKIEFGMGDGLESIIPKIKKTRKKKVA